MYLATQNKDQHELQPRNIGTQVFKQSDDFLAILNQDSTFNTCSAMLLHKVLVKFFLLTTAEVAKAARISIEAFINIITTLIKEATGQSFPNTAA